MHDKRVGWTLNRPIVLVFSEAVLVLDLDEISAFFEDDDEDEYENDSCTTNKNVMHPPAAARPWPVKPKPHLTGRSPIPPAGRANPRAGYYIYGAVAVCTGRAGDSGRSNSPSAQASG